MPKKDGELSDEELEQVVGGSKDMKNLLSIWRGHLNESVGLKVGSFEHPHQNLNQALWSDDDKLKQEIKEKLIEIAERFIGKTQGADAEIKDITFTGSLANYNYSAFSDIDLHILIDFKEINDDIDLVKDYFNAVKALWNLLHDIRIKGYEVEVYVQDAGLVGPPEAETSREEHISSGVYSILDDEWLRKPEHKKAEIDNELITKKADSLMDQIDRALEVMEKGKHQEAHDRAIKIRKKIKKMRQAGLESDGEYSSENLAFKTLRNNGYLGKLSRLKRDAYDKMMSLNESWAALKKFGYPAKVTFPEPAGMTQPDAPMSSHVPWTPSSAQMDVIKSKAVMGPGMFDAEGAARSLARTISRGKDYYDLATTGKPIDRSPGIAGWEPELSAAAELASAGRGSFFTKQIAQSSAGLAPQVGAKLGTALQPTDIATATALPAGTGAPIPARPATTPTPSATTSTSTPSVVAPVTPSNPSPPTPSVVDPPSASSDEPDIPIGENKEENRNIRIKIKRELTESQLYQIVQEELIKEFTLTGIDVPRIVSLKRPVKKRSKAKDQVQRIETDLHATQDAVDRLEEYTREIYNMLVKVIRKNK